MECSPKQKVALGVFKLESEAEYWWMRARKLLESKGTKITWVVFQNAFFDKYFPDNVKNEKEAEFIQIRQEDRLVGEYETKFEDFSKFSSYLKHTHDKAWKACHFERGLRVEIREKVATLEINNLSQLVNKCRIAKRIICEATLEREKEINERKRREMTSRGNMWKRSQKTSENR